eukprot:6187171-Pleurochrysis_carterae.AAC.3
MAEAAPLIVPPAPGVFYCDEGAPPPRMSAALNRADHRRLRHADVRLRRALQTAWVDPETAQGDLCAATAIYAELQDPQGMAHAYVAHADARRGVFYLGSIQANCLPNLAPVTTAAHAGIEYSLANRTFTGLQRYDTRRGRAAQAAMKAAKRPVPLSLNARDFSTAILGGDEMVMAMRAQSKARHPALRSRFG